MAAARANALEQQVTTLSDRYSAAEDTIQKLSQQLEELLRAKDLHETHLMANFAQLLNEKKLKIRNQQRLLVSATEDPAKGKT
jgi:predicted  nucleic acid-binding Zn-ribbon protein